MEAILYLAIMLAIILFWFILLKRPVYEAVLISFIALVGITNQWTYTSCILPGL